jgi:hypothetical protein
VRLNSLLINETKYVKYLIEMEGKRKRQKFKLKIFNSDAMLIHNFFKKFKLIYKLNQSFNNFNSFYSTSYHLLGVVVGLGDRGLG